jgi:HAD superfamily hydrolase (TIGR01509 family)
VTDDRAVLFDLDDTLCRYRRGGAELLSIAFERVGVEPLFTLEAYHERYPEFVDETEGIRDLRRACFVALAEEAGHDPEVGRAIEAAFADERDHGDVEPLPGARQAVETLAGDHRLGLVTNGAPEMQRQKLDGLGLADRFETVVYAGYDAPGKPAPEPFHAALDDLGVPASRAVHVGNSLSSDVAGAHAAGVESAWLAGDDATAPDPTPDYRLRSLSELTDPPWR